MATNQRRTLADSVEGTSDLDFGPVDWGQLLLAAMIFGSAFMWIAIGLRSFDPGALAFFRVALGASALALLPSARCRVRREDWPRLGLASVAGIAGPVLLFAFAEERISSALAGMLVSGIPIVTAIVAAFETRRWPRRRRLAGLTVGFAGIVLLAAPGLESGGGEALGVSLVLLAVIGYSTASTLYAPLQQTYGSLRVTLWLLVVSTGLLLPLGLLGLSGSRFEAGPVAALAFLGVVGTGMVWAMFVGLVGRVGAVRSSVVGYLIPVFALVLGVSILGERVEWIQVVGVGVALAGGYLLSQATREPAATAATNEPEPSPLALEMCR